MKEIVAFHIACPITSKRICSCALGFPRHLQDRSARGNFLDQIAKVDEFLKDPWLARVSEGSTVQVPVPKVVGSAGDDCDDAEELVSSAKRKRSVLQKKAAVVEGFARRFECGVLVDASKDPTAEDQAIPKVNVLCQLCLTDENEESEGSKWMLPCRSCGKKYHGSCLKTWSQYRDLFHWSSWTCPSCRVCKVCHTTGETTKFKFCKRCDVAVHCYCMQPPHKNVSSGPYLCPKHTKCHSCGSNVPGNGLSVRWFLGYTCCDACGRLFTKGNYCPVCLKVYRDSEPTPMICCDMCQQWVHCECDGISDEKYLQFQTDGNLPYTCPTCRGKCCQVRDLEDAVQELWRRRDEADKYIIASLRAAAGLPTQEEFFSISPFSDDEENDPNAVNREQGVVNFSFKSLADFSPKKTIESAKKPSSKKNAKKKGFEMPLDHKMRVDHEQHYDGRSLEFRLRDEKKALHPPGLDSFSFPTADLSRGERMCSTIEQRVLKHKSMNEVTGNNTDRKPTIFQSKSEKTQDTGTSEDVRKAVDKSKNMKGTRLVVHLGGRNKTMTSSLRSDSLSRVQELMTLSGGEAMSRHRMSDYSADRSDGTANSVDANRISSFHDVKGPKQRERNIIKLGKGTSEASVTNPRSGRGDGLLSPERTKIISSNISKETRAVGAGVQSNVSNDVVSLKKHPDNRAGVLSDRDNKEASPALEASPKVSKNLLRLKFKTPYPSSWAPNGQTEIAYVKGQRAQRKRPSPIVENAKHQEKDTIETQDIELVNEMMDANWILKKLG